MKPFLLLLSFLSFYIVKGDSNASANGKGEYVISHGQVIFGDTDINLEYEDAILRSGNDITHYPPSQIEKVAVINEATGDVELYHSGSFGLNNKQYLFKILVEGQTTLLYREGLKFSEYEETEYAPFFILVEDHVYALSTDRKEIVKQLDDEFQKEVASYIKDNKLDLSDQTDMAQLFNHYNLMTLR